MSNSVEPAPPQVLSHPAQVRHGKVTEIVWLPCHLRLSKDNQVSRFEDYCRTGERIFSCDGTGWREWPVVSCLLSFEDADIDLPLQQNIGLEMFYFCMANTLIPT